MVYNKMELDSHADTVVLGGNCIVLNYTTRECNESPYMDAYDAITNVPIGTRAIAWNPPQTGETFILVFHEALWITATTVPTTIVPNGLPPIDVLNGLKQKTDLCERLLSDLTSTGATD
jgi:hypothetical protein